MTSPKTQNSTCILGISGYYHDSAACLIKDGSIVAAAQEERFTRKKHDPSFPRNAIRYCLEEGNVSLGDLNQVAFLNSLVCSTPSTAETRMWTNGPPVFETSICPLGTVSAYFG